MKFLKGLGIAILVIVVVLVAAVLSLPLWIGPVVTGLSNKYVPTLTKTDFHVGVFELNPYQGQVTVGDLQLANPKGYDEPNALTLGRVYVNMDMSTVTKDVIRIDEIAIEDVCVSYLTAHGTNNLTQIQNNVMPPKAMTETAQTQTTPAATQQETASAEKKFIIGNLTLKGLRVKFGYVPIPLPTITLTGIGEKSNGATAEEVWNCLMTAVLQTISQSSEALQGLMNTGADFIKDIDPQAANTLLEQGAGLLKTGAGTTTETLKDGSDATLKAAKQLMKLFGE